MARSSSKKPGEPKCRGSKAPVEGRDWVRIGGAKWLREVAEQKGKYIPLEYREGGSRRKAEAKAKAAEKAEPTVEMPPAEEAAAPEAPEPVEAAEAPTE